MEILENQLIVKQEVEMSEAFLNIETENKYKIFNREGVELYFAFEESNFFSRILFKNLRPLRIKFLGTGGENLKFEIRKSLSFFLPKFEIYYEDKLIGIIKTKFSIKTKIEIFDNNENLKFISSNTFGHIWTYNIYRHGNDNEPIGKISKEWSGSGKEFFTDADNFLIDFGKITEEKDKKLILALSIVIDLFKFEK